MRTHNGTLKVRVARIETLTPEIKRFTLVDLEGKHLPAFSGGSHVVVVIDEADKTYRNAYSLMNSPYDSSAYQIAVRRVSEGRGGSRFMHTQVKEGDLLQIMQPAMIPKPCACAASSRSSAAVRPPLLSSLMLTTW